MASLGDLGARMGVEVVEDGGARVGVREDGGDQLGISIGQVGCTVGYLVIGSILYSTVLRIWTAETAHCLSRVRIVSNENPGYKGVFPLRISTTFKYW